jgi:CHAT domain-containing protein
MILLENGNAMERGLKYYRTCIEHSFKDEISYDLLWKKLAEKLKQLNAKKVYFSADGLYHQVSMPTLYNPATQKYLLDEIELVNLTNTKDILSEKREATTNQFALLLGAPEFGSDYDPLPGTSREVEAIGSNLKLNHWEAEILKGRQAHEQAIKDMQKPRVLHIATHGYFEPEHEETAEERSRESKAVKSNPLWRSGLILTKDRSQDTLDWNNDGILTAYEAMNLNLDDTELVVLSACETGLGDVRYGEGVYGLQRAFKVAGANLVLMSLWKVSDEATEEFMKLFYQQWLKTPNARQAFESTQAIIRSEYPDPRLWGAFVLVGE